MTRVSSQPPDPADGAQRQPSGESGPLDPPAGIEASEPIEYPSFGRSMAVMWTYTVLRFGLFVVLWGLLYLFDVGWLISAAIALALSVPLSWVLLARPRRAFAANLEQRVNARVAQRAVLDARLEGFDED